MPFVTANFHTDLARGSMARGDAELANAAAAFELSRPLSVGATLPNAAIATTASKAKTVNAVFYTVGGAFFTKGATDNLWTLGVAGSATTVAASSFQKYLLLLDTAGAATVLEGTQSNSSAAAVTWRNISAVSAWAAFLTAIGSTKIIAAVATVATDATHTFVPGTTAFNGTGITTTFIDGLDQSILPLLGNEVGLIVGNGG